MQRCIQLAKNGLGTTYPNPMVGSVIIHNDQIIGEGWHHKAGEPHAEVNAVNSVNNKDLLKEATIYVSLEPCSHFGKTPPCSDLIIRHKIPNVVIGTVDPFSEVSGRGIKKLTEAGINVSVGILENECNELNKRFFTFHQKKRPYIILKWAESLDGFIAPDKKEEQKPVWISNKYSRQLVHKWRSEEQSILVGTQTVIDDNPKLNTRDWHGNNPIRIVLDKSMKISKENHIFDNQTNTVIFTTNPPIKESEKTKFEFIDFDKKPLYQIVESLYQSQIQSVIVEGGRYTLQSFIEAGLWDEARIFKGETILKKGTKAPSFIGNLIKKLSLLDDELIIIKNDD